jgi:transglutaminase-like putative cysteine protease
MEQPFENIERAGTEVVSGPRVPVRLTVTHTTVFDYAAPVCDSINTLHLEPRCFPFQRTLSTLVRVLPATRLRRFPDLFQNVTHHFELPNPHSRLEIESRIKVENLPLALTPFDQTASLDEYGSAAVRERTWPYLQDSRFVSNHPVIWRQAIDVTAGRLSVYAQAHEIMRWIHGNFTYRAGSTDVNTHLEEAFGLRSGVCQDFTHVMLGMCRAVGIPARYASGYLYNGPRDSLIGSQASHAWPEVYLPDSGWIGFDPTNNTLADARYVKVAVGRDYDDVAPVKGGYRGTAHCRLQVSVLVERVD